LLEIPGDWDAVVRSDAELAREWQDGVRRAFEAMFARGYAAVGFVMGAGEPRRCGYLLRHPSLRAC
jgi:predicted GNAT superfamily acetyltransferase